MSKIEKINSHYAELIEKLKAGKRLSTDELHIMAIAQRLYGENAFNAGKRKNKTKVQKP